MAEEPEPQSDAVRRIEARKVLASRAKYHAGRNSGVFFLLLGLGLVLFGSQQVGALLVIFSAAFFAPAGFNLSKYEKMLAAFKERWSVDPVSVLNDGSVG